MNRPPFKPLTLGLIAALVITAGAFGLYASRSSAADATKPAAAAPVVSQKPALTVSITQAHIGVLPIKLSANGSVLAWQEASVGAETNGLRVQELHASVGDSVKRGQLLATFAADSVQADVALARAAAAEAAANAAEATANADRARTVQGTGALSAQQVNQYLTAELTAKARVESAKAQLDSQQLRLRHTRVLAPDSGIISARSATVGSVVGNGTELFRLIRQGRLEWRAEVTSVELGRIAAGTGVVVTSPSGAQYKGKVRMVSPTVDAATRNGLVYVDLLGPVTAGKATPGDLKPGMFARGEFELGSSGALTVVQTAVVVRDGFSYVYRVGPDNRVAQLKVQTGRLLGDQVEILGGLKPEDRLVASGAGFLSDSDLVRVVDAAPAAAK
ncbi:MAG: efflux RND transporter periplasmic adaptor subunit [Rhodoferax sp.]|nr:efflux RND transporter periplasmic adaptor subunit [Rhodoferax sp.]